MPLINLTVVAFVVRWLVFVVFLLKACVISFASLAGMCRHKQMWQYLKQSPAHHLPTCVMPYVGIITSNLTKRKRPGKSIFVFIGRIKCFLSLNSGFSRDKLGFRLL